MDVITLDKDQIILQFRANPNDEAIFELFYCPACHAVVSASGLFPAVTDQLAHAGHRLAWLPAQDSPLPPLPPDGHIQHWLESYRPRLDPARYAELAMCAPTINSGNWVWVLQGSEQTDWLAYLADYLERLAQGWLDALNGLPSDFFPIAAAVWRTSGQIRSNGANFSFRWADHKQIQPVSNPINPPANYSRRM